jgi:hypothetical protein
MRLHLNRFGVRFAFPAALVGGILVFSLMQPGHFHLFGTPLGYGYGSGPAPQPLITAVSPTNGPPAGGQTVTITGAGFGTVVTVKFGVTTAVPVGTHTSTTITVTSPAHAEGVVDVTVSNTGGGSWEKTNAYVYLNGVYTVDAFGGVHAAGASANKTIGPYFSSKLARSMVLLPGGGGGFVLDGWGGIHPWSTGSTAPVQPLPFSYFQGFDIARDIVLAPTSNAAASTGYTLDGWGGVHAFGGAPAVTASSYFKGFDIAKRLVLFPDVKGGYVLDGWGGIHPFATGGNALPAVPTNFSYFQGFNIARDIQLIPGSTEASANGFTLDGYGGIHPFNTALASVITAPSDRPYWNGFDIGRAIRMTPDTTGTVVHAWILDGWGGIHEVNDSPDLSPFSYWAGMDIAKQMDLN